MEEEEEEKKKEEEEEKKKKKKKRLKCCVLSGGGLCARLIPRPEESYRVYVTLSAIKCNNNLFRLQ